MVVICIWWAETAKMAALRSHTSSQLMRINEQSWGDSQGMPGVLSSSSSWAGVGQGEVFVRYSWSRRICTQPTSLALCLSTFCAPNLAADGLCALHKGLEATTGVQIFLGLGFPRAGSHRDVFCEESPLHCELSLNSCLILEAGLPRAVLRFRLLNSMWADLIKPTAESAATLLNQTLPLCTRSSQVLSSHHFKAIFQKINSSSSPSEWEQVGHLDVCFVISSKIAFLSSQQN